jgi:hypothetical protein
MSEFFDQLVICFVTMEITQARFVGNPRPIELKNPLDKFFQQFRVLADTISVSKLNRYLGPWSWQSVVRCLKSVETPAKIFERF